MNAFRRNIIQIWRFPDDPVRVSTTWDRLDFSTMTLIADALPADIQQKRNLRAPSANLPGDVSNTESWQIFFNYAQNAIRKWDIVVDISTPLVVPDDRREMFQITSPYWTVFQYQCLCELLQT